jgi:asparagine synthase (glutamine-hydrolysing)
VSHADIGRVFPEVVWHVEVPITRTAPAPMFLLSRLVRAHGFKVVLTGEGADEFLAGYDIFKEAKVRRFWARQPASQLRPKLLQRLYPDVMGSVDGRECYLAAFFRQHLTEIDSPIYSHVIRWQNNRRACRFLSQGARPTANALDGRAIEELLPARFRAWTHLAQAQYLETKIFLSQYLLSAQGDRVAMAHAVEGRFPFLDHRLVAFCNQLPETLKLRGLSEKYLLKKLGQRCLPPDIARRPKRPYRAPIHRCFFGHAHQDYVREILAPPQIKAAGLFDPAAVSRLVHKVENGHSLGETDDMALVGIISTQLLHRQFIDKFESRSLPENQPIKVCSNADLLN